MLDDGSWEHPGDDVLLRMIPFVRDPLEFRSSVVQITSNKDCPLGADESENSIFHEYRASLGVKRDLPWRDVENSLLVAINRFPGDDVGIGLDYRSSAENPRVIASEWIDGQDGGCFWREVAPTFTEFLAQLASAKKTQNKSCEATGDNVPS
jgi:hypothetical protein